MTDWVRLYALGTPYYHGLMLIIAVVIGVRMVRDNRNLRQQLDKNEKVLLSLYKNLVMHETRPHRSALGGD